jgi:hypothetical protein
MEHDHVAASALAAQISRAITPRDPRIIEIDWFEYQIKGATEPHERVVRESEPTKA